MNKIILLSIFMVFILSMGCCGLTDYKKESTNNTLNILSINETAETDLFNITLLGIKIVNLSKEANSTTKYLVAKFSVKNIDDDDHHLSSKSFIIRDNNDFYYKSEIVGKNSFASKRFYPGERYIFNIYFKLPKNKTIKDIMYMDKDFFGINYVYWNINLKVGD